MTVDWEKTTYDAHYGPYHIRWAGTPDINAPDYDADNVNGERIGEPYGYGLDFARYIQRGIGPFSFYLQRAHTIITKALFPLQVSRDDDHIVLVGCEHGYTLWALRNAAQHPFLIGDFPNVYGVDKSAYIEANHIVTGTNPIAQQIEDVDILFGDWLNVSTADGQNTLDAAHGRHVYDIVINGVTESFGLDGLDGVTELAAFNTHLDACETGLAGTDLSRIVNLVDTVLEPGTTIDDEKYSTHNAAGSTIRTIEDWAAVRPAHSWLHMATGEFHKGGS